MPCPHRFQNDLYPNWEIDYLFVGTFNPAWDRPNGNNADWFYGRYTNDFWYIMPQVFGFDNMMHLRNDREALVTWCRANRVGITDLFQCIEDANAQNPQHLNLINGVLDDALEEFENITRTNITRLIRQIPSLKGVYLTRYCNNLNLGGEILNAWQTVAKECLKLGIPSECLVTPSRGYHVITRDQKIQDWQEIIFG